MVSRANGTLSLKVLQWAAQKELRVPRGVAGSPRIYSVSLIYRRGEHFGNTVRYPGSFLRQLLDENQ